MKSHLVNINNVIEKFSGIGSNNDALTGNKVISITGVNQDKELYLSSMQKLYKTASSQKALMIIDAIELISSDLILGIVNDVFQKIDNTEIKNKIFIEKILKNMESMTLISKDISQTIRPALEKVAHSYLVKNGISNINAIRTFTIKLILWSKSYVVDILHEYKNGEISVFYYGNISEHEEYFLYFMHLLELNIVYVNPEKYNLFHGFFIDDLCVVEIENELSQAIKFEEVENFRDININVLEKQDCTMEKLEDFLLKSKERVDVFSQSKMKIPQLCAIKYGYCDDIDSLKNRLYLLDSKLKSCSCKYIKFEDGININPKTAINERVGQVLAEYEEIKNINEVKDMVIKLIEEDVFDKRLEPVIENTVVKAFADTLKIYFENKKSLEKQVVKNFLLTILYLIDNYLLDLTMSSFDIYNPKLIYSGEMTEVQSYQVMFITLLKFDVLILDIRKENRDVTGKIAGAIETLQVIDGDKTDKDFKFPKMESIKRESTVAYSASKEIESAIYTSETGVFKPWQLESLKITPLNLKTTYDEIGILWNEPANLRPYFNVETDKRVSIPNIFAKINGVHQDIEKYWEEFHKIVGAKNVVLYSNSIVSDNSFYDDIQFMNHYENSELAEYMQFIGENGLINREKLTSSNKYKFGYLKDSLQVIIMDKIDELYQLNPFLCEMSIEFKLRILATLLDIYKISSLMSLLETFDYSSDIPKIVLYLNSRSSLPVKLAIILAFMNRVGADILILTPTSYKNIENHIKDSLFDTHSLSSVALDLRIAERTEKPVGIFKSFMGLLKQ